MRDDDGGAGASVDGGFDLGLSAEELASMKSHLSEMKKKRDEQRAALKRAWMEKR